MAYKVHICLPKYTTHGCTETRADYWFFTPLFNIVNEATGSKNKVIERKELSKCNIVMAATERENI